MTSPLAGIRVLDLSSVLAGPFATQQLLDLGADVVKVEAPLGDATRGWGPPFAEDGRSAYFLTCNRGKRSIVIDLAHEKGPALLARLARRADILVENFRPGLLARWGIDLAALRDDNPGLITASISGFGVGGARAGEPGYDALVQAMSGLISITGPPAGDASGHGYKVGVAVVDIVCGLFLSTGVLACLRNRDSSSSAERHLEVSLQDSALALLANVGSSALMTGAVPERHGNAHPSIVPYEVFEVADGALLLAVGSDRQWRSLTECLDRRDWWQRREWRSNPGRVRDRERLVTELRGELERHTTAFLLEKFGAAGIPAGPVRSVVDAFRDPAVTERGQIQEHPDGTRSANTPLRLGDRPASAAPAAPRLGEHSAAVLAELGLGAAEIERWCAPGGVCHPPG